MEKWISVDDCYPVIDHMGYLVLFIMQDKLDQEIMIGEWNEKTELWETEMSWSGGVGKKYVTHWMPLPSPPMEVQE
jgi:hypothetical protein